MSIFVIRHGQTDYNLMNVYQGHTDIPLNDKGIEQAKETAKKFEGKKIDAILVSPLSRAKQTAKYVSDVTGIIPIVEEGLIERSFGDMEGHHNREDCNLQMLLDYNKNYDICNVEPIQTFIKRISNCMDKIIEKYQGKNIVLVTHGGVSIAIECYFNGIPEDQNLDALALRNCEVREYSTRNIEKKLSNNIEI